MLKSSNGFTLIEALVAMSIFMMLIVTILPIHTIIKKERNILHEQLSIMTILHDELQQIVWADAEIGSYSREIHHTQISFTFVYENKLIKGCAEWENVKQQKESICLYGYKEK